MKMNVLCATHIGKSSAIYKDLTPNLIIAIHEMAQNAGGRFKIILFACTHTQREGQTICLISNLRLEHRELTYTFSSTTI